MKRSFEYDSGGQFGAGGGDKQMRTHVGMAVKLLVSQKEASQLIGRGGATSRQISEMSGAKIHLSGLNEFYPGTQMQEVGLRADSGDAVANGVLQIFMKLSEETGKIMGGEPDVEEGGARVHFILPTTSARNLIGRGGENIKMIRQSSGMKVHVEELVIGNGDLAEQVVSLAGPVLGIQEALPRILERVAEVSSQPWFSRWALNVHAAGGDAAVSVKGVGKGKHKDYGGCSGYSGGRDWGGGKDWAGGGGYSGGGCNGYGSGGWGGSSGSGYGGCGAGGGGYGGCGADGGGYGCGGGYGGCGAGGGYGGCGGKGGKGDYKGKSGSKSGQQFGNGLQKLGSGAAATTENIDMLSAAVSALPASLANTGDRSQTLTFNCPAELVSALIGKGAIWAWMLQVEVARSKSLSTLTQRSW
eukprot:TRINITY_DN6685_c0_g1_i3.p1 TRINITY_DN6685_c0_g1~~TRINITY_DN6685_c0_g1_i3.p1  ORF type:complete len:414 (-),score=97.79 TRINITY_DN6685_c0_g1_i3:251-1492(-)